MATKFEKLPIVAIVGRPNVGKSSLFNRILHRRIAIVHDLPGVTRDRNYAEFEWNGRRFVLVDTGGLLPTPENELEFGVVRQVENAIAEADLLVFVVEPDIHPEDFEVADLLRRSGKPAIVVINKVDDPTDNWSGAEAERFGLGEVFRVSAKYGHNTGDFLDAVVEKLPPVKISETEEDVVRLAIVGHPNVGKSSYLNKLLGKEIALVHHEPGTTRDPVNAHIKYYGTTYEVVDTAGLYHRQKEIDFFSALRTIRVLENCDVALLLLDATLGITRQDKRIADMALSRYRGLVIAVNKWDLVENKSGRTMLEYEEMIRQEAPFLAHIPIVFISARTGLRVRTAFDMVHRVAQKRRERVKTSELNQLVWHLQTEQPPPVYRGRRPKIYYATQVDVAPPSFVFFARLPKAISPSYRRYITNKIREQFGFDGVPFKLIFRDKRK
ncbi:ribosome biogenesis GTPase Der [bacterium]|nr:ribosome biogenesis GTPase Der [bacterium]